MTDVSGTLFDALSATAVLSDCGRYRYHLTRTWDASLPVLTFVMCNPSIADAWINDPTIVRGMGFARRLGCGGMAALNAYAWRATKPADLWAAQRVGNDVVGPESDEWLTRTFRDAHRTGALVVAAWGAHPKPERVAQVLALPHADNLRAFGTTKNGHPRHPLMLRSDTPLAAWPPRTGATWGHPLV